MTLHVFANIVTQYGTAANNRGENQGNATTLQKLLWQGRAHTTVSAEAIRFAIRRRLEALEEGSCNRTFDEDSRVNDWKDDKFKGWSGNGKVYADDDLLGFMKAEAAKEENVKGTTTARRAVLEVTRAVSLTPWSGDVMFNAASPNATASAAKKGAANPVPYAVEVHATRYQYGLAMTPSRLREPDRAGRAIQAVCALGEVAGNHARYLYDFSPDSVVFRVTSDPAPRLLYCFEEKEGSVQYPRLLSRVAAGDVKASELILGGEIVTFMNAETKDILQGASLHRGVCAAAEDLRNRIK